MHVPRYDILRGMVRALGQARLEWLTAPCNTQVCPQVYVLRSSNFRLRPDWQPSACTLFVLGRRNGWQPKQAQAPAGRAKSDERYLEPYHKQNIWDSSDKMQFLTALFHRGGTVYYCLGRCTRSLNRKKPVRVADRLFQRG